MGGDAGDGAGAAAEASRDAETVDAPGAPEPDTNPEAGADAVGDPDAPAEAAADDDESAPDLSPRVAELEAERDALAAERDSLTSALAAAGEDHARELESLAAAHAEALGLAASARDEALEAAEAAHAALNALSAQWADFEVDRAIRKALDKYTFIGVTPELRERACRNFISQVHPDVEAYRDAGGTWRTRVKGGGSVAEFVRSAVENHAYLFTRLRLPGIGAGGGHVPPDGSTGGTHFGGGPPPARFPAGRG